MLYDALLVPTMEVEMKNFFDWVNAESTVAKIQSERNLEMSLFMTLLCERSKIAMNNPCHGRDLR